MSADDPIDEAATQGCYDHVVVDLDKVRVALGWPRTPRHRRCKHQSMVYSTEQRRVWCKDCESTIETFDAWLVLIRNFEGMMRDVRGKLAKASAALSAVVIRRAAKEIDRTWGQKMAPCCPHCRRGLLPEDFANGASSATSAEFERARRKRAMETENGI
jgi:hypothetical protein